MLKDASKNSQEFGSYGDFKPNVNGDEFSDNNQDMPRRPTQASNRTSHLYKKLINN